MFYWGAGSTLGLLTCLGYGVFVLGSLYLWRNREELTLWVADEFSAFRRNLSPFESCGSFYLPRTESRLRVIPVGILHAVGGLSQRRFTRGAFLLVLGLLLFTLDFFI